ncbi:flagellin [Limnohabitans sp.]|uniref:flagellin N-terminal helical domain-containing protein n=1 Tax=Limnohabitans sp. TaxID=1907725 RepID=UPI00286EBE9A|nr:flagellin [Limnohabitans sp.]
MSVINTNVKALAAQGSLSNVNKTLQTSMERLSTGLRINSAKDDAAGLAITNRMTSQIRGYGMAIRNANDGTSMLQTAEGAMGQVTNMLQRMRELSIQSANGGMTSSDRASLQDEVTQLKSQIQEVATSTNHNTIKLLDGSAGNIKLQTGVKAGDMMSIGFSSVQTKDLGLGTLSTVSSVGGLLTGNVNAALTDGSLTLNGVSVGASLAGSDDISSANKDASAIAKAAAINAVSDRSGVFAVVSKNEVAGSVAGAAVAADPGMVKINGFDTAGFYMSGNKEIDRTAVVQAINDIADRTGVTAINTHDDNQGISLVAADGRNIVLAAGTTTTATLSQMGMAAAGTYVGSYQLSTKDGSAITVGSTVATSQTSELRSGIRFGTYESGQAQAATTTRTASAAAPSDTTSGILLGNTLVINGVGIQGAQGADDDASFENTGSTKAASALAIAAAINKASDVTGVTAKANANSIKGTSFTAAAIGTITLNGIDITTTLGTSSTREDVLQIFNSRSGETGVTASAYGDGIELVAADGRNISIGIDAGTAAGLGLGGVTVGTNAAPTAYYAGVTLSSDKAFTLNSGSEGDTKNFKALGFSEGTFGGANDGAKVAEIDISTVAGSTSALLVIDAAIEQVGKNQAKTGAFLNRLDAVVSNLTESTQNMSESRSRILDTDYATETTNLAKSQIVQQAATAMLAQANQSAQSVLSLLK